jgi:PKD repeat protein
MTTPRQLITGAMRLINVVQANEVPSAADMDISFEALNGMLDSWSNEKLSIYSMNPYEFSFKAGQQDYTLGTDGDWPIDRPMELQMMYTMYDPNGGQCLAPLPPEPDQVLDLFTGSDGSTFQNPYKTQDGSSWIITDVIDWWFGNVNFTGLEAFVMDGTGQMYTDINPNNNEEPPIIYPSRGTNIPDTMIMELDFEIVEHTGYEFSVGFLLDLEQGTGYLVDVYGSNFATEVDLIRLDGPNNATYLGSTYANNSLIGQGKFTLRVGSAGGLKSITIVDFLDVFVATDNTYVEGAVFMNLYDVYGGSDFHTRGFFSRFETNWNPVTVKQRLAIAKDDFEVGMTVSPTIGATPLDVTFTPISSEDIYRVDWWFDDGLTDSSFGYDSITHTYDGLGEYYPSATIVTYQTNWSVDGPTIYLNPDPNMASFTQDVTVGDEPLTVTFTPFTAAFLGHLDWDFGDGTSLTTFDLEPVVHVYDEGGSYLPVLTMQNSVDTFVVFGETVTVIPYSIIGSISADQTFGALPLTVTFTPTADHTIDEVEWDFGDGNTIETPNGQSVTHTYTATGQFQSKARIKGGNSTDTDYVDVVGPVITVIKVLPQYIDIPVQKLTYDQWSAIGVKSTTSVFPYKFYDNGDYPLRTISVWPIPTMCHKTKLWLWQPLINAEDLDTDIIFPKGYERAIRFALAVELASEFGKDTPPLVSRIAQVAKSTIKRLNSSPQVMTGDIAIASNQQKLFNYITGDTIPTNM